MWRAAFLAVLALASSASARALHEKESDFAIEIGGPGATVCIVRPEGARDAACNSMHLDALPPASSDERLFALVHQSDASYAVSVSWAWLPGTRALVATEIQEVFHTIVTSPSRGDFEPASEEPQVRTVHDRQVISFATRKADATLIYEMIRADNEMIIVTFGGDVPLDTLYGIASTAIATFSLPVHDGRIPPGAIVGAISIAVLACTALALVALRLRRRDRHEPEDDVDAWGIRQRQLAGVRIGAVGQLVFVPAMIWLVCFASWDSAAPITRVKVTGGIAVAIGLLLTTAGFVIIARNRKPPLATAIARERPDQASPS